MHSEETTAYPILENLQFVDEAAISEYFRLLFSGLQWSDSQFLCLRGIGEKGTKKEGGFRDDIFLQPKLEPVGDRIIEACKRWAQFHVAAFCVPAVLKAARGKADNVALFTNILCDLDSGNTDEKLRHIVEYLGEPTMVIASGGTTEEDTPKRHIYYCLTEPTADIAGIVTLRDTLARKVGADLTMGLGVASNPYGRAHQPVRIAGTSHAKGGIAKKCYFEHQGQPYALEAVSQAINTMPFAPWIQPEAVAVAESKASGNPFSPTSGRDIDTTLMSEVHEGGTDTTRFSEFNRVAGFNIRCMRDGKFTQEEALQETLNWVATKMIPPWPDQRVIQEFNALVNVDSYKNGVKTNSNSPNLSQSFQRPQFPQAEGSSQPSSLRITDWAAHKWAIGPKPKHQFLVDKLIIKGEPHIFVSEGGAGKTYQVSDLAMKIAAWCEESSEYWCGQRVLGGGTVVLLLCEDSKTEMHIRLMEIDKENYIQRAGDKLIVIPMTAAGGAFSLVSRDKDGSTTSSKKWDFIMHQLKQINDLQLVAIDTFNSMSHGDENSAQAIAEMMREAHRVCGETGAALLFNHHIRKDKEAIKNLKELSMSIRGSSAIPSYFRICMGLFHATDYDRRMRQMGLRPEKEALWRFGIAKANIHGLMRGEKTLLRSDTGLLEDVTYKDKFNSVNMDEREAWMVFAIKIAAQNLHPYAVGGKNAKGGLYKRRAELPPILRKVGDYEFVMLIEDALQSERITQCAIKGGKTKGYYDVVDGPLASDPIGAEINSGAYIPPVDWDEYVYDNVEKVIILKRDHHQPFKIGKPPVRREDAPVPLAGAQADEVPVVGMLPRSLQ